MARNFNGSSDDVVISDNNNLDISTGLTVCAWINRDAVNAFHGICGRSSGSSTDGWWFTAYRSNQGNDLNFMINNADHRATNADITSETWFHVAATWDGSDVKIYENGTEVLSTAESGSHTNGNGNLIIGNEYDGGATEFDGDIADFRYYVDTVLNQDQIRSVMRGKRVGTPEVWMPLFGEASPEVDYSGNGYSGTVTGTTVVDNPPFGPLFGFDNVNPSPTAAVGNITESVPNGTLNLTGFAPTVSVTGHVRESIPSSNLYLTGFAPTVYVKTENVTEQIPSSNINLTPYAPSVSVTGHVRESVPNSNLYLNSYAPTVYQRTDNVVEQPLSANLYLTAFAPTTYIVGNAREQIPNSVIQLSAYAPTVRNTSVVPTVRPTGGISKRVKQQRKPKPRIIMVDGKTHQIESPEQELFILQAYRDKLEKQYALDIVKKKVPAVKRKIKLGATNIKRVETRINKVKERISWLKKEDEEILAILAA